MSHFYMVMLSVVMLNAIMQIAVAQFVRLDTLETVIVFKMPQARLPSQIGLA